MKVKRSLHWSEGVFLLLTFSPSGGLIDNNVFLCTIFYKSDKFQYLIVFI